MSFLGQKMEKSSSTTKNFLAPGKYAIDVEPILSRNRNNRVVHLDYLRHLKESVETLNEIVEKAKVDRPLDKSIVYACRYTKHSQELLEYAIGTCPKDYNQRDKKKKQGRADRPLVFGLRLFKTYDGRSLPALKFGEKVHRDS
ncbi:hypothetical protein Tco_1564831 [Tanacetum coccineum]